MPSTWAIILRVKSASASLRGARVNPQLPPMTEVTPWLLDGVAWPSQYSWAS